MTRWAIGARVVDLCEPELLGIVTRAVPSQRHGTLYVVTWQGGIWASVRGCVRTAEELAPAGAVVEAGAAADEIEEARR